MGDLQIIDGSGFTATFTDAGVKLEPSSEFCIACNDDRLMRDGMYMVCSQCHCRQQALYMTLFKCNGCSRKVEFLWLDQLDTPEGFKAYQCTSCGTVGVKNIVDAETVPDSEVSRCIKCGDWQFRELPCHTCALIRSK